ncbi:Ig-like domain-containing protein [Robertkochia sediminum]|uniref:Ig-like domain-containing protein n=1 Tax=Robertkochia sediminum TaxID=2785326 RepID=UPI0019329CF1|nr:Ig-like domain-containing protein [Robertkochia sediminum]MBL7471938.1 Ig-like domain-containing protein [Robertkochia sediminum]
MRSSKFLYYSLFFGLMFSLINCAKRSTPTGGPKDETPPEILSTNPDNYQVGFDGNKITLTFDELVKLNDLQKQLIVSPPLKNAPMVSPQGSANKKITIELLDTLKENTTYVLNFGQSIVDYNEGNPYPFYSYVFSTGSYIDSLELGGFVTDASQKEPDNFVSVMLYEMDTAYTDSAVFRKQPTYITNTLDSLTDFRLTNLKEGKYRLIAIKDENNDNLFSPKTDKIGFVADTILIPNDTIYELTLFREVPKFRATRPSLANKNKIVFGYEGRPEGMKIELLSDTPEDFRSVIIQDRETDTLNYYFTPFEADSLLFRVEKETIIDTFTVRLRELYNDTLQVTAVQSGNIQLTDTFAIAANTPLTSYEKELISILDQDSTAVDFSVLLEEQKNEMRLLWLLEPGSRYDIQLLPGAMTDLFEKQNDTLQYRISTKELGKLGTIRVKLQGVDSYPIVLQLTDQQNKVKASKVIREPLPGYNFSNIDPGNYMIRVIHDVNGNGKWDTGDFLEKRQPERISYYPEMIELRANWEIEQTFILGQIGPGL